MMNYDDIKTIVTHDPTPFHADEVFAVAMLTFLCDAEVVHTRKITDEMINDPHTIIVDVGHGEYDHHQSGGNGARENGVPYASAGLIWRDFGEEVIWQVSDVESKDEIHDIAQRVDDDLIQGIDAIDNGVALNGDFRVMTVSSMISAMNPGWNEDETPVYCFNEAVKIAKFILFRSMNRAYGVVCAKSIVHEAFLQRDNHIVILPKYVPWDSTLLDVDVDEDVLFVIYPATSGGIAVRTVPKEPGSMEYRLGLPEEWWGLPNDKLKEVSGIESIVFVHKTGFMGAADTMEDAIKMAEIAIQRA